MTSHPESEATLRRFLLGDVSDDEREALERRFLGDAELFEQICALEDELRIEYARGGLSPAERRAFEALYLQTAGDQTRLAFATVLGRKTKDTGTGLAYATKTRPLWRAVAIVGGGLVLAVGIAALVLTRAAHRTLISEPGQSAASRAGGSAPASPAAPAQPMPSVSLTAGLTRSAGAEVVRVGAADALRGLRVELKLPAQGVDADAFELRIADADGHDVRTISDLHRPAGSTSVIAVLPPDILKPGDYQLTLRTAHPGASGGDVADYYLRVLAR